MERLEATADQVAPYAQHVGKESTPQVRPNIVGVRTGSGGRRSLLLNGHVDTVGPGDPALRTHPPFSGAVDDNFLYGRGACDIKGGIATIISAIDALHDLGIDLRDDVTVATTVGEEDTGVGALTTVLAGCRARSSSASPAKAGRRSTSASCAPGSGP